MNSYKYSHREIFIDREGSTQSPVAVFLKFSYSDKCVGAWAPQQSIGTQQSIPTQQNKQ